jgi:hypothetical protein
MPAQAGNGLFARHEYHSLPCPIKIDWRHHSVNTRQKSRRDHENFNIRAELFVDVIHCHHTPVITGIMDRI